MSLPPKSNTMQIADEPSLDSNTRLNPEQPRPKSALGWWRAALIIAGVMGGVLFLGTCHQGHSTDSSPFLNTHDSVGYVGMATCRSCHPNVYETFIHTGMGQSFGQATPMRSLASFDEHAIVYDSISDFYYRPFFKDSILYIREYRLQGQDTIHDRTETVEYIVGSGHHTNSHIISRNGYLYQAPITFYTQDKRWDMAPGFETSNARFSRILTTECITCHNDYPEFVQGSANKYTSMPEGIACERCHGPGELHVKSKLAGEREDTSLYADYTIVNPKRLSRDLATDICQRCHLQGIAVLKPDKDFFDFRPGLPLSDVMHVYLPRFTDSDERFIMASQADRLRMSACYLKSESLTCITCHNPHVSVASTGKAKYNSTCNGCHTKQKCSIPPAEMKAKDHNCVGCHMPPSSSIDIPHVSITDHYIRKQYPANPLSQTIGKSKGKFLGLQPLTALKVTPLEMAEGYIALYDKFINDPAMLDSAQFWLDKVKKDTPRRFGVEVHLRFAQRNYEALNWMAETVDTSSLDAWTAYRLGEGYLETGKTNRALPFLQRSISLAPYNLDFLEKCGLGSAKVGKMPEAIKLFNRVLLEQPDRPLVLTNLGFIQATQGNLEAAKAYYLKALALDPDQARAKENLKAAEAILNKRADRR